MKLNIPLCVGCAYVAFWVGASVMQVGEPPRMLQTAEWYVPLQFLVAFATPLIAGFMAGKEASSD